MNPAKIQKKSFRQGLAVRAKLLPWQPYPDQIVFKVSHTRSNNSEGQLLFGQFNSNIKTGNHERG